MSLFISARELAESLKLLKPFSGSRIKPILNYAKVDSRGRIHATDIDSFAHLEAPSWETCDGSPVSDLIQPFLLPIKEVISWLATLPKQARVQINLDYDQTALRSGESRLMVNTPREFVDEFPVAPRFQAVAVCDFFDGALANALASTEFATDTETTRFASGAVLLDVSRAESYAVATDGHRLISCDMQAKTNFYDDNGAQQFLIPAAYASPIAKLIGSRDCMLYRLETSETACTMVTIWAENCEVTLRLVEGRFPRWREVVTMGEHNYLATFNAKPFYDWLRTCKPSTECLSGVFTLDCEGYLDCATDQTRSRIRCERFNRGLEDEAYAIMRTRLNVEYLREFAKLFAKNAAAEIDIAYQDSASAVILLAGNLRYIVMPLSLEQRAKPETESDNAQEETAAA